MPLITFIPIPTKFVGAGFPVDMYIYNARWCIDACDVSVSYVRACARVPSSACLSIMAVSLLKFAIEDNLQIDRNLDDKIARQRLL